MGLLTAFANKTFSGEEQLSVSDESTEEFSEEESSSSNSSRSEDSSLESTPPPHKTVTRRPKKHNDNKLWQHNLSARSNQDIQRAYEENVIKELTVMLSKKCVNESSRGGRTAAKSGIPLGGIWVRLESEWRDSLSQNSQCKVKTPVGAAATKFPNKPRGKF